MPIVSLIARPGGLDAALAESLRNAWGGGDVIWLSPDEAAEFAVPEAPTHARAVFSDVRAAQVDIAVTDQKVRRKSLLIADMDSTMIDQECIDELAEMAGIGDAVRDITARAMNGELNFEAALTERVGLLKGLSESVIDDVYKTRISLAHGGRTLVQTMKANGARAALVSGGFTPFTQRVSADLGFDENRANGLIVRNGVLTGDVERPILGKEAKVEALYAFTQDMGGPDAAIAVGDGANDLGMLGAAGLGVALHAKPSVAEAAPVRIDSGDLTALLFLQGYRRDEFVD